MRRRFLRVLMASFFLCGVGRAGTDSALRPAQPLPEFPACRSAEHPRMPERWRAVYLMAPFTTGQPVVAEIVHDAPLDATRFTLYGVARGVADFLVTGRAAYELASDSETVTQCRDLGDTGWRPLPPDWLAAGSQCTG